MLAVFAAALLGFLVYNRTRRRSSWATAARMFIGFFLAAAALLGDRRRPVAELPAGAGGAGAGACSSRSSTRSW